MFLTYEFTISSLFNKDSTVFERQIHKQFSCQF